MSKASGIPIRYPPEQPFSSLLPLRLSHCVSGDKRIQLCHSFYDTVFGKGKDISSPENVRPILEGCGFSSEKMLEMAATQTIKDALRDETQKAIDADVFGVPTVTIPEIEQLFWGVDQFGYITKAVEGIDNIDTKTCKDFIEQADKAFVAWTTRTSKKK